MSLAVTATKLVVRDADAAQHFYTSIGLKAVGGNIGGDGDLRQKQCWLSATGDMNTHVVILTQFLERPPPRAITLPGEAWLVLRVEDVDAMSARVQQAGGSVVRAGQDLAEFNTRAAILADPEGHVIELVGPMLGR